MADENRKLPQTLTDYEIVTEPKVARRAFLGSTGVLLAGGAVAVVAGARAFAQDTPQQADPDKAKQSDPDKPKQSDPDKPRDPDAAKQSDPDKPKQSDPDKPKQSDPDKPKAQDPDKPKDPDAPPR